MSAQQISRVARSVLIIVAALAIAPAVMAQGGASTLGANAAAARRGPRSEPAEGGAAGTVDSVSPSSFAISTPAGVKVTVEKASSTTYLKGTSSTSAGAIMKGESVLVLGTVNLASANGSTITASQV